MILEETPAITLPPVSNLATVARKNSLSTERNLWQNQLHRLLRLNGCEGKEKKAERDTGQNTVLVVLPFDTALLMTVFILFFITD